MTPHIPFPSTRRPISRRRFLRGAAVAPALPLLESMCAPFARAAEPAPAPPRMFCICNNLGLLPEPFFPRDDGRDYTPSPYLKLLQEHRADFTVLSGVSHPSVDGGHAADVSFLTAAPHPGGSSFRNSISLDQLVAERIGTLTRCPSLTLAVNGGRSLSWTRLATASRTSGHSGSAGCRSGVHGGRKCSTTFAGTARRLATCPPALSSSTTSTFRPPGRRGGRTPPAPRPSARR
jgi:hypothetical protein